MKLTSRRPDVLDPPSRLWGGQQALPVGMKDINNQAPLEKQVASLCTNNPEPRRNGRSGDIADKPLRPSYPRCGRNESLGSV